MLGNAVIYDKKVDLEEAFIRRCTGFSLGKYDPMAVPRLCEQRMAWQM